MKTLIYGLEDPQTGLVRYVGQTADPVGRMKRHTSDRREHGTPKQRWAYELHKMRLVPRMIVLDAAESHRADQVEADWIAHYGATGQLFNIARPITCPPPKVYGEDLDIEHYKAKILPHFVNPSFIK